jgi:tRNA threonylcarbamoyladenosine modification (KEOPS) complex  Pcc1 subunit
LDYLVDLELDLALKYEKNGEILPKNKKVFRNVPDVRQKYEICANLLVYGIAKNVGLHGQVEHGKVLQIEEKSLIELPHEYPVKSLKQKNQNKLISIMKIESQINFFFVSPTHLSTFYQSFLPGINEIPMKRSRWQITPPEPFSTRLSIVISADDATAYRATINSLLQIVHLVERINILCDETLSS